MECFDMKIRIIEEFDHRRNHYRWIVETRKSFFSGWKLHHVYGDKLDAYDAMKELRRSASIPSKRVIVEENL